MTVRSLEGTINRLLVFRACKQFMEHFQRQPAVSEIVEMIGPHLSEDCVRKHMAALHGADGLPFPLLPVLRVAPLARSYDSNSLITPVPVDRAITRYELVAD